MDITDLKSLIKDKNALELREIICKVYIEVPEAKDFIDIIIPHNKEIVKQNTAQLLKRYKKQFQEYLLPDILENNSREEEAYKLLERIRKKDINTQFIIDCEFQFIACCKEFILTYGYFDEDYYITIDEVFESACAKIKDKSLIEEYRETVEKLLQFGNEYGFGFDEICKELEIYQTLL